MSLTLSQQLGLFTNQYPDNHLLNTSKIKITASFIIPIFNSADSLGPCVDSISKQTRIDRINEVILVNDGSTDHSSDIIESLKRQHPELRIVSLNNVDRKYAAFSRNRGIERSTGDLVCFIDSDIILPPDYLSKHIDQQAYLKGITFSLRSNIHTVDDVAFPVNNLSSDFRYKLLLPYSLDLKDLPFQFSDSHSLAELCLTCAVTYWRKDLVQVKGCPENFVGWGFNDTAMAAKVIALGRPIAMVRGVEVCHLDHAPRSGRVTTKWSEFSKNKKRYINMLQLPTTQTFEYYIQELS